MSRIPAVFFGPPLRWALIPSAAVGAVVAAVLLNQQPGEVLAPPVKVTALKPSSADDLDAPSVPQGLEAVTDRERMPMEVRYGVPSPATAFLWVDRPRFDRG
jgi:hypothetical protein